VTTVLVIVILAVIWAAVLVPPYLQNRRETRPGDSIASFRSQLSVLERTTPGGRASAASRADVPRYDAGRYAPIAAARPARRPAPPSQAAMRRAEVRRRRRDVFLTLLGAVGVTFVLGVALGGTVWMLHLAVDLAFIGYVGMLVKLQQDAAEKDQKVRYMQPGARNVEPQLLLRRSGS
jgi:hypothetical protein